MEQKNCIFKKNKISAGTVIFVGVVALFIFFIIAIFYGSTKIAVSDILNAVFHFDNENLQHLLVVDTRIPRAVAAILVGAALATSGAIIQGLTLNPLADPGLVGLNAGAGFALAITFAFFPRMSYTQTIFLCFFGAIIAVLVVFTIAAFSGNKKSPMGLILAGVAVSTLLTALSQGISLAFDTAQDIMFWTVGGVSATSWEHISIILPIVIVALSISFIVSGKISIMSLGSDTAQGLGVDITKLRIICFMIVAALAGIAVSVVGSVSFVGLMVPHLARFLIGTDYKKVLPVSAVMGGLLLLIADILARTINPPFETPIGALISLIGVPFFIYLSNSKKGGRI